MLAILTKLGGDLDDPHAGHRRALVTTLLFHGLADFARRRPLASSAERRRFTEALIGSIVAMIEAGAAYGPPSLRSPQELP